MEPLLAMDAQVEHGDILQWRPHGAVEPEGAD